jgi:hypothetical protein
MDILCEEVDVWSQRMASASSAAPFAARRPPAQWTRGGVNHRSRTPVRRLSIANQIRDIGALAGAPCAGMERAMGVSREDA